MVKARNIEKFSLLRSGALGICFSACFSVFAIPAHSAVPIDQLPGPADIDRVLPTHRTGPQLRDEEPIASPGNMQLEKAEAPEGADKITFNLESIKVEGVTAFDKAEIDKIYTPYLGKEQKLSVVWEVAAEITKLYRDNGYFLSRAYVPAQEIEGGDIVIKVAEGHIESIEASGNFAQEAVVKGLFKEIILKRPISVSYLESALLLLNDIPGVAVRAVLTPDPQGGAGVNLVLVPAAPDDKLLTLSFDNHGSKFLGPYQLTASLKKNLISVHETSAAVLLSAPTHEMKYFSLGHKIPLTIRTSLTLTGTYTDAKPGHTLKDNDIMSDAASYGMTLSHFLVRQRDQNLELKLSFDARNSNTDILGTPLTRDRIRTLRPSVSYDFYDSSNGYNYMGATISQGLDVINATPKGDLYISRLNAKPNFFKIDGYYSRLQNIGGDFMAVLSLAGQYSNDSLHSSEEFSYGGIAFGRAYDSSEISGDKGVNASIEVSYNGLDLSPDYAVRPYVFYDVGKVWNNNIDQINAVSGTSTGVGFRAESIYGIGIDFAIAYPLTLNIGEPIYSGPKNPRYLFKISYGF